MQELFLGDSRRQQARLREPGYGFEIAAARCDADWSANKAQGRKWRTRPRHGVWLEWTQRPVPNDCWSKCLPHLTIATYFHRHYCIVVFIKTITLIGMLCYRIINVFYVVFSIQGGSNSWFYANFLFQLSEMCSHHYTAFHAFETKICIKSAVRFQLK